MKQNCFIVNITSGNKSRSQIWHAEKPLLLGKPGGWILEPTESGAQARDLSRPAGVTHGPRRSNVLPINFKNSNLSSKVQLSGNLTVQMKVVEQLKPVSVEEIAAQNVSFTDIKPKHLADDEMMFRRSLKATFIMTFLFFGIIFLMPKTEAPKEELIPEQFAKIIMKSAPKAAASAPAQASASSAASAAKASQKKSSVVQAFKSTALQAAASQLLKGGMTKLLAQSDFVSGSASSDKARKMLNARSDSLQNTAPNENLLEGNKVQVASLGGDAHGSGSGKGVGYGKGEHAGVKGQGQSFVKIDSSGSTVDEGLTRDEVGEVIHRHMSEIRYCYEASILKQPHIEGKLILAFTIGGTGSVKTVDVKSSTLQDPGLDDCILRRLRSWQFPKPRGGVDVAVSYPFIFKSLGG